MAVAESLPETFEALHVRLGLVPLNRIRTRPAPGTATEEDLERADKPICELIDGVLVEKPMGTWESLLGAHVARLLGNHVEANDLGIVLGADGHIRVSERQIRAPDATFIPWASLPDGELPREAYWMVAPGLIVEVLSPGNTKAEIDRKLNQLFSVGCQLAWVIDPRAKTAKVYSSPKRFKELDQSGTLDGGKVLPGFKLVLDDLFAAGNPRKKRPR
jgi:Uma2 family endonuclease